MGTQTRVIAGHKQPTSTLLAPGVSHALARWRARHYSDVGYRIDARLTRKLDALRAAIAVRLTLHRRCDIVLDWRAIADARISSIRVNSKSCPDARIFNEHIIIPASAACAGENTIALQVRAPIGAAGSALMRYRDRTDDSDYVYTLCVPADARTLLPCFDQPDLKARFTLSLTCPSGWQVISNAPRIGTDRIEKRRQTVRFAQTERISTYLFAFAAGPFVALTEPGRRNSCHLYLRRSQAHARQAARSALDALRLNRAAVDYVAAYTRHPFPYAKYDLVLIPEFAFNGMEHAGATFLREESVLLAANAPAAERGRRINLILHETAHQWFGNLVTMRWFDDVWIKEAFANWMAARAAAALAPECSPWLAFALLKASAADTDATRGATPLRQPLANLADAKSLYGNIVYGKGPAVLRQLEHDIGTSAFRRGVRALIARHAHGVIDRHGLIAAFSEASRRDLAAWAAAWITRPGLARIMTRVNRDGRDRLRSIVVEQSAPGRRKAIWPQRFAIALIDAGRSTQDLDVHLTRRTSRHAVSIGERFPRMVVPNDGDFAYGTFVIDPGHRAALLRGLPRVTDPLRRWLIWSMIWESVREAAMAPMQFLCDALRWLPRERDPLLLAALLDRMQVAFRRYCADVQRDGFAAEFEAVLLAGFSGPGANVDPGIRTSMRRAFIATATTNAACERLRAWTGGEDVRMRLSIADRFRCAQRLSVLGAIPAPKAMRALARQTAPGERARLMFATGAAERGAKRHYLEAFLDDRDLPESWIEEAMTPFNAVEHAAFTLPLLSRALRALPELKRVRRIFFVNRWLTAFVGGQCTAQAAHVVRHELRTLPLDLRRKTLEVLDELARTVRIRQRFSPGSRT